MSHPALIWIFNASLIFIVLCPFVDNHPYISSKYGAIMVFLYSTVRLSYWKIQTEQIISGDLGALKDSSILKTKTDHIFLYILFFLGVLLNWSIKAIH